MKLLVLCALLFHLASAFTFTCTTSNRNCYTLWAQHNTNSGCYRNTGCTTSTPPVGCAYTSSADYAACGLTVPYDCGRTSQYNYGSGHNFNGNSRTFDYFSEIRCTGTCTGRVDYRTVSDWNIRGKCDVGRGNSNSATGNLIRNWAFSPTTDSTFQLSGDSKSNAALIFMRGTTNTGNFWQIASANSNTKNTFTVSQLTIRGGPESGSPSATNFAGTLFNFQRQVAVNVNNVDFINLDSSATTTIMSTSTNSGTDVQVPTVTFNTVLVDRSNSYATQRVRTLFSGQRSTWSFTSVTVRNYVFHHESSVGNGVFYGNDHTKFTMTNSFVRDNSITVSGGNVARSDMGGLFLFENQFNATFTTVEFINNKDVVSGNNPVTGMYQGGIIAAKDDSFIQNNYRSSVVITTSKFENNLHMGDGTALAFTGEDLYISVTSTTFKSNTAQRRNFNSNIADNSNAKGTIFLSNIIHGKFTGNTYEDNTADHGCVFYITDNSLIEFRQTNTVEFKNNKVTNYGSSVPALDHFNRGRGGAGAIAIMDSQVSFWNTRFISNGAEYGGALDIVNSHVYIHNALFEGNTATFFTNHSDYQHGAGGAIRMTDSRVQISETTFRDNLAHNGGAIFARQTGQTQTAGSAGQNPGLILFKSIFTYTEAVNIATQTTGAVFEGGSIYAESLDVQVDECEFTRSKAKKGGAVRVVDVVDRLSSHNHILRFRKSKFTSNWARSTAAPANPIPSVEPDFAGGAISTTRAIELIECEFISNQAHQGHGGAVDAERGLTVDACQFNQNSAPTFFGGAIYTKPMYQEQVVIRDSDFLQNSAGSGGAIFTRNPLTRIDRCSFRANRAFLSTGNGLGGAINFWSRGIVTASSFRENTAESDGAAIYATAQVAVDHSTFTLNGAPGTRGGAIKCVTNPSATSTIELALSVVNSVFTVNSGSTGSAIWTSCDTKVFGTTFDSNAVASAGNSVGDIYCSNSARSLTGCKIDVANSTFQSNQPYRSLYIEQPANSFENGHLWLRGSTFNGAAVWVNGNVDIYAARAAAGKTTRFTNGGGLKAWGASHVAMISGVSTSSATITVDSMELAVLGSLMSDSSSSLIISNTRVKTTGATELGGLSLGPIGGPEMALGGNVIIRGSGAWTGSIGGAYNITFMSGSSGQWQGGDIGVGGNIIVNSGASLSITQHSSTLRRPIWNYGMLTFASGTGTGINFAANVMNMAGAHLACGPSTSGVTNIGNGQGGTIFNWGNIDFNGLCNVFPNTFLYQSSHVWFDITSDVSYDTASFQNYVQFAGALTARDHRDFNPGPNGSWDWKRDFGTKYNLIRLRSSYRQSTYNQFRARDVAYVRNWDRQGVPGFRVRFPVPGKSDQPPYLLYGFGTNRSYIFLSNPASFLSISPVVLICSLIFALW